MSFCPIVTSLSKRKPYITLEHEVLSCKKVLWTHCYIYLSKTIWIRPLSVVLSLSAKLFFLNLHHFVPFSPFCPKKKSLLRLETKGSPCKKLFQTHKYMCLSIKKWISSKPDGFVNLVTGSRKMHQALLTMVWVLSSLLKRTLLFFYLNQNCLSEVFPWAMLWYSLTCKCQKGEL